MFGGSFNPIHKAHIKLAEVFIEKESLTDVLVIPTLKTPLKDNSEIISPKHRFNMCSLAADGKKRISVSDIEIKREGESFTSDTIKEIKSIYTIGCEETEVFLIVGADMFLTLDKWHDFEYIFENATILASLRDDVSKEDMYSALERYKSYGAKAKFYEHTIEDISSTEIRKMLKNNESVEVLSKYLDTKVIEYIKKHGLYGYGH